MRIDTGTYTGNDGGVLGDNPQVINLTNCVGDCSVIATVIMIFVHGAGAGGPYFTTNTFDINFATSLYLNIQEEDYITTLTTQAFTADGECNVQDVVFYYLVLQYDGITQDIETGQYVGNGLDNQTGLMTFGAWTPDCAMTNREGGSYQYNAWRTNDVTALKSASWTSLLEVTDKIQAINSGNCELGTHAQVNKSGNTFNWFVLGEVVDHCSFVTYVGNDADNRDLALLSFQPKVVLIKGSGNDDSVGRTSDMVGDVSFRFRDFGTTFNAIQAINVDGFQVGTAHYVNEGPASDTQTYYAWCFKDFAGASAGGNAPTGTINGPLVGPLGGPI